MKNFDTFGVMIDMSRNAVMNLPALKKFMSLLAKMGYNCVMLYTEDTYEVDGEPYFGYMRGRYTKAEMKEIDTYAKSIGIEIIPCIQTLAHLNALKRWGKFPFDYDDILMVDDPRTYELIDHMFATLKECFSSGKIHIGMDEAQMIGKGAHQRKFGAEEPYSIMKRHLDRVCELVQKYDYEALIWSDMFFRPWNNGAYYCPEMDLPKDYVQAFPKSVTPVYWDYYASNEQRYTDMLKNHKQLSDRTWFAGGVWSWLGMIPFNRFSIKAMTPAINACIKQGTRNIFMTMWGDDGAECSHFSQLPSLFYIAEYASGNTDTESIKAKFKDTFGIDYDAFISIDDLNDIVPYEGTPRNPSKYMLYSDCFNDFLDYTVKEGAGAQYKEISKQLYALAGNEEFGYVFESAARLSDILQIKYELGLHTRRLYEAGDKDALRNLAQIDYHEVIVRLKAFIEAFRKQWMTDNKPHGFDVQELRLGGLMLRLKSCKQRILDYVSGELDKIEELDEKLLPFRNEAQSASINRAPIYSTVNVIHHNSWTV